MATELTLKQHEVIGVSSAVSKFFLLAIKGVACILGGIGGFIILATLALPVVLVVSFLLKLIVF